MNSEIKFQGQMSLAYDIFSIVEAVGLYLALMPNQTCNASGVRWT